METAGRRITNSSLTTEATSGTSDPQGSFGPKNLTTDLFHNSYYEGRNLMFQMSYCNESKAQSAVESLLRRLPLHPGYLLWLLDRLLLQVFPEGGTLNCADPSLFPKANSLWPKISQFCERSRFCLHPHAEYLWSVAERASQGTYATQKAVVSLHVALKMLRTSVQKQSFQKVVEKTTRKRRNYVTIIISAVCTPNLRPPEDKRDEWRQCGSTELED